jgi:hypothetical protein
VRTDQLRGYETGHFVVVEATEGAADQALERERARMRMVSVRPSVSSDVIPMTTGRRATQKPHNQASQSRHFRYRQETSAAISPQEIKVENFSSMPTRRWKTYAN